MDFQLLSTSEDRRYKVLEQNAMQAGTYLAELHVNFSRAEDEFMCAHKKAIEQITKCREAIKIAEAFEYKFQIARSTYNEAAREGYVYGKIDEFQNFQMNAQHLQFFELSDGPLKRDFDLMLKI